MTKDLVNNQSGSLALPQDHVMELMASSAYPACTPMEVRLIYDYCAAKGFDPLSKPVHLVKMPGPGGSWIPTVMQGINALRVTAERTGLHSGTAVESHGNQVLEYEVKKGNAVEKIKLNAPIYSECIVKKRAAKSSTDISEWKARVYFTEAVGLKKTGEPNSMWLKRPYGMLEKCAEAAALRRAFPDVIGEITIDEAGDVGRDHVIDVPYEEVKEQPEENLSESGPISPEQKKDLIELLKHLKIDFDTVVENVECFTGATIETLLKSDLERFKEEAQKISPNNA